MRVFGSGLVNLETRQLSVVNLYFIDLHTKGQDRCLKFQSREDLKILTFVPPFDE
jgi:hypothetical protein